MTPKAKKLLKKCEALSIKIVKERDNYECQVHRFYPHIKIPCSGYLQADHCITRKNKWFYLDTRNLTLVCGAVNRAKSFKQKSCDEAIKRIVIRREGQEWFDYMVKKDMQGDLNPRWGKVGYFEQELARLTKEWDSIKYKYLKDIIDDWRDY